MFVGSGKCLDKLDRFKEVPNSKMEFASIIGSGWGGVLRLPRCAHFPVRRGQTAGNGSEAAVSVDARRASVA